MHIDAEYEDAEDGEAEVLPTDSEALPVEDAEITENAVKRSYAQCAYTVHNKIINEKPKNRKIA